MAVAIGDFSIDAAHDQAFATAWRQFRILKAATAATAASRIAPERRVL
jgi:hypothetical protein